MKKHIFCLIASYLHDKPKILLATDSFKTAFHAMKNQEAYDLKQFPGVEKDNLDPKLTIQAVGIDDVDPKELICSPRILL